LLRRLEQQAAEFVLLSRRRRTANYHEVLTSVYAMCATLLECEAAGVERATLVEILGEVRAIHARSPFVRRLQQWPRGYAGDFDTVRYICAGENRAPKGTIAWECEQYALSRAIAQQHRNKVHHQSARILRTLFAKPAKARILSLACGSCPDFELIAPHLPSLAGAVVLNDADEEALAYSREVLQGIGDRCQIVPGNVMKVARHLGGDGPFDLVLAGGLFDYLPDRAATLLIRTVAERLLAPGGSFFFTNIAQGNPYRPLIEYFGDWFLIERSEEDIRQLCREAILPDEAVTIRREETGLALLIDVTSV
jgi:SAM-dependent methyltransferase